MKKVLFIFLLFSFGPKVQAQQLVRERLYKLSGQRKIVNASATTRQGNIMLSGNYTAQPGFRALHMLVKPNTDTLWLKESILLANGDQGVKQTPDGGFIIFSTVPGQNGVSSNRSDMVLYKIDSTGQPNWIKYYDATFWDTGRTMVVLQNKDYILAGDQVGNTNNLFLLTLTDSLGKIKWQKDYTWSVGDYLMDMKFTPSGNIIMAGMTTDANFHGYLKLLLVNQNGDSIRGAAVASYSPTLNEAMHFTYNSVTPLTDGGFLVTSRIDTVIGSNNKFRGMVVKVDSTLKPVWRYIKHTNPVEEHVFTKCQELTDGSVLVLSSGLLPANNEFKIYRFSPNGALLNTYTFTTAIASTLIVNTFDALPDSTYLIGGEAMVSQFPYQNGLYVAKVKLTGIPQPVPPPVIVTGIKPDASAFKASLGQSYPNPAQAEAIIPYGLPIRSKTAVITINEVVTGRQVKSYPLSKGESSLSINLNNLSNGIYTYTLYVDEKPVATKKLSVIR